MPLPEIIKIENIASFIINKCLSEVTKTETCNDVYRLLLEWYEDGKLELRPLRDRVVKELNKCQH